MLVRSLTVNFSALTIVQLHYAQKTNMHLSYDLFYLSSLLH